MQGQIANFEKLFNLYYSSMHKMKNRLLLSLTTLFLALPVLAATLPEGVNYAINSDGKTLTITKSTFSGDLVIPETVDIDGKEYTVKTIGSKAFKDCKTLTSVTFPSSLEVIFSDAFNGCSRLTSVVLPTSLTDIYDWAFANCYKLTSITIPPSVKTIWDNAFYRCRSLTSVDIPSSVTRLTGNVFSMCNSLVSINVAAENANYKSVDGILFNKSMTELMLCPAAKTFVDGKYSIPRTVEIIGETAFYSNSSLQQIDIPSTVTTISNLAFGQCSGLTSVEIPSSVATINSQAFWNCTSLASVTYNTVNPIECLPDVFSDETYSKAVLYVAEGGVENARTTEPWRNFTTVEALPTSGIDEVGADATIDNSAPVQVYNMQGVLVGTSTDGLAPGAYIVRQGSKTAKIAVGL